MDQALGHGIDGFICTWWGQGTFDDRALKRVLDRAKKKGFLITVYWETVPGEGAQMITRAVNDLGYLLDRYGSHPAFLKVDGKPVIFVYGRVMQQVPSRAWPAILAGIGGRHQDRFLLVADGFSDQNARLFDGIHNYNICGWVQGKDPDVLRRLSRRSFNTDLDRAERHGKISCITVIPGYNDTKIRSPGIHARRMDGHTYRVLWEEAIRADPDWVLITSWNEWHEGSEIEPSLEHGSRYLEITGEYAARFKTTPFRDQKVMAMKPGLSEEKKNILHACYQSSPVALLSDYKSDAVFWLLDTGLSLKELTWEAVLDPKIFNVNQCPVTVYAGGERYTQTVKSQGDVDNALERYLREGGLLMVLSSEPFPFYYNERGKPVSTASRFGLPILGSGNRTGSSMGGWEMPPQGVRLSFRVDRDRLKSLPAALPFPETGDLRWRPGSPALLEDEDLYLPLASLMDEEDRNFGDGIFYVEHRASSPKGAKILYAWMGMAAAADQSDLYFELFRFAGERRKN
jgi:hypothetical protein